MTNRLQKYLRHAYPRGLRGQIAWLAAFSITAAIGVSTWYTTANQIKSEAETIRHELLSFADNIAIGSASLIVTGHYSQLEETLLRYGNFPGVHSIQVSDVEGRIIAQVDQTNGAGPRVHYTETRLKPPAQNVPQTFRGAERMTVWYPIEGGAPVGWVRLDYRLDRLKRTQARLLRDGVVVGIFALVTGVLVFFAFLSRPMQALARATDFARQLTVRRGDVFDVRYGATELTQLGVALNEASRQLHEQERALFASSERLRAGEERFRAVADTANDAIVSADSNGDIIYINKSTERVFGYTSDEVIGKSLELLMPSRFHAGHRAGLKRFLESGHAHVIGRTIELAGLRKSGSEFPLELSLSTWTTQNGRFFTGVMRDISGRKRAAEEMARLAAIVTFSRDAIIGMTPSGVISTWNEAAQRVYGYSADEIVGRPATVLMPPESMDEEERILERVRRGEYVGPIDTARRRKDGSLVNVSLSVSPILDGTGHVVGASKISRDITEQLQARRALTEKTEELMRSNRDLEQFAYVASHDLQEPLRMVASYTQLLSRRYRGQLDKDADEFIGFAVDGVERMQRLIQDLLGYSRVGMRPAPAVPVDMLAVLDDALRHLHVAIKESGAQITHDPLPVVRGDRGQLLQLLQNLIGNALKFRGDAAPKIHMSAVRREHEWMFGIHDNGIGIDPQYHERIFVIFQRLHDRRSYAGTGIGLAICRKIVEHHGGHMWLESEPGKGATFYFSFPHLGHE